MNLRSLRRTIMLSLVCLLCAGILAPTAQAESTAVASGFTYQGALVLSGTPVNSTCDFEFTLYDALTGGSVVGSAFTQNDVAVTSGLFTVELDFGANVFDGAPRWLAIRVRCGEEADFNLLSPRHKLTVVPQALYARQVSWNGITDVPAALADGDNDTIYTAGYGLTITDSSFAVNTSTVQSRVTGICAVGEGIQQINADGTVVCDNFTGTPAPSPSNIVWVAKVDGDFTTITAALDSIIDASAENPYLIKVAPGVYVEHITLKDYVDIEGSGQNVTIVRGFLPMATVFSNGNTTAEVRSLSIENNMGDGISTVGDISTPSDKVRFDQIAIRVVPTAPGVAGVRNNTSSPTFSNVTIDVEGTSSVFGMDNLGLSSPSLYNVTIVAEGTPGFGLLVNGGAVTVRESSITGNVNSVFAPIPGSTKIANTMLGGLAAGIGLTCVGAYNENFAELPPTCFGLP
ncbi:MAG: hypothetical protein IT328_01760 [Caldilineaceae bacterium]|nr:hypothetical protein [Caldilineaceae bacterium]